MQFSWLDPITWQMLIASIPSKKYEPAIVKRWLLKLFDGITVYHASRPLSVESFYQRGLELANHSYQAQVAANIFLSGEYPELSSEMLDHTISELPRSDNGLAYVILDKREFMNYSGHYLIYGSEYLCAIAANLGDPSKRDYREVLKQYGMPTIFRLNLPFPNVRESDAEDLAKKVSQKLKHLRVGGVPEEIDFTFTLTQPLPPEYVLDHEHPTRIIDPLQQMSIYHYRPPSALERAH